MVYRKMKTDLTHYKLTKYYSGDKIMEGEMGGSRGTYREEKAHRNSIMKPGGKRLL
jgi:hypothetical protein